MDQPEPVAPTLRDFVCESYLPAAAHELAPSTLRDRTYVVTRLVDALGDFPVGRIPTEALETYKADRLGRKIAVTTVRQDFVVLQAILRYAEDLGLDVERPRFRALRLLSQPAPVTPWTDEEMQRIFWGLRKFAPFLLRPCVFMANTGVRPGELVRFQWPNIRLTAAVPYARVLSEPGSRTKTGRSRDVPLGDAAREWLPPRESQFVFVNTDGRPWRIFPRDVFNKTLAQVGVDGTAKTFRHTYASRWLAQGGSMWGLSRVLGHSSITVTERTYAHMTTEALRSGLNLVRFAPEARAA
jgi:integrase/recombinase XerD